jgi:integrase
MARIIWEKTRTPGVYVRVGTDGQRRYKVKYRDRSGMVTSRTFPTEREARKHLAEMHSRSTNRRPDSSKASRTMEALWGHLAATYRGKPSTFASYEARWSKHIKPALGSKKVGSVNRSDLTEWLEKLEKETSLDTRRKVQQVVHKMLAVAVDDEWIDRNPATGIQMPSAQVEREPRPLTDEEVAKLADEVPDRYYALVWMLAETGARPGELLALRVKNLNGTVRIAEAMAEVGGRRITGTPKTKGSIRNVPISPRLKAAIQYHADRRFMNADDPESLVFTMASGGQISQSNLRKRVLQPAAERLQIEGFTTYDLRHTAISLWLMRGLTPFEVSKMVGHATVGMIEQRYGHLYQDALQEKIDRLATLG